jgi:hypothetical protein
LTAEGGVVFFKGRLARGVLFGDGGVDSNGHGASTSEYASGGRRNSLQRDSFRILQQNE